MNIEQFQNLVIGSGVAGKLLAWTLAKQGQRTVCVERAMIGGSCPNVACLPSKNVVCSAMAGFHLLIPPKAWAWSPGRCRSMAGVARRKRQMVEDLVKVHLDNFHERAEPYRGEARFSEPRTVHHGSNAGGRPSTAGRACLHQRRHTGQHP